MRLGSREPAAGNVVSLSKKHSEHALVLRMASARQMQKASWR